MIVAHEMVTRLYEFYGVTQNSKNNLLQKLSATYNDSSCYNRLAQFFNDHEIEYKWSSWV